MASKHIYQKFEFSTLMQPTRTDTDNNQFFQPFLDIHVFLSLIYISIDSEWSKTQDFEGKNQNNLNSFQIHIFTFQNILHLFILKKIKEKLSRGQGVLPAPPPFYGHVRNCFPPYLTVLKRKGGDGKISFRARPGGVRWCLL